MIFKINMILIILILFSSTLFSGNSSKVSGKVIDSSSKEPLIGVNVLIVQSKIGTVTDLNGKFELRNISDGEYTLRFSYLGYTTVTKNISIPGDQIENITTNLEEAAINLNEIIITGNPFLFETKELSQTSISLSKLDLIIAGGGSVADKLNFQPGIAMRSNGISTGRPVIRGFSNNKVLILEDGLRMGDLSNASDDHSVSNDGSDAEKVEVIEGPSSLLYGSNAIGGVINILTDAIPSSIQQGLNGEIILQGSSVNSEYLGNTHLNYGFDRIAIHGKFFKRKGTDYKISGGDKTFNSDVDSYGTVLGFSYMPDWGMIGFSYDDYKNKYGLPTRSDAEEIVYIDMNKKQYRFNSDINNINSFVTSFSLKAGFLDYNHKEISKIDASIGTEFGMKTTSLDLSFIHLPFLENSNGIIGFYGLLQNYNIEGNEALTPNADYKSFAVYFLEKFKFDQIGISFGARYELNNLIFPEAILTDSVFTGGENTFNSFSASLGVVYSLNENVSLFTNIANAFRAPTIEELSSYAIHEALASFDIGNRSLKKEITTGIDIGLRAQGEKYYFEISGYFNKVSNLIYRKPLDLFFSEEIDQISNEVIGFNNDRKGFRVNEYNQANANVYGFESKLSYEFIKGFTSTIISDYVRAKNQSTNENLPQIPPFRFSIDLRYSSSKYWLGTTCNLVSSQKTIAPNEEETAGYGLVGLYGGIKLLTDEFAHIINLKVNNLFDKAYKDHLSAIKDFTFMPGRNISITYKLIF